MKRVDWTKSAAIAEVVGTIAVVISLVFVGISIRQNTAAVEATQLNFLTDLNDRWYSDQVTNPDMYELWLKADDFDSLTDAQKWRLQEQVWRSMLIWEELHRRYEDGLINEKIFQHWHNGMLTWFRDDASRTVWDTMQDWPLNPELRQIINEAYGIGADASE